MLNLNDVAWAIVLTLFGYFVLGSILKASLGSRWRNSIRGLLVATALIAIAIYFIVSTLQLYDYN